MNKEVVAQVDEILKLSLFMAPMVNPATIFASHIMTMQRLAKDGYLKEVIYFIQNLDIGELLGAAKKDPEFGDRLTALLEDG